MKTSTWLTAIVEAQDATVPAPTITKSALMDVVRRTEGDCFEVKERELYVLGLESLTSGVSDAAYPYLVKVNRGVVVGVFLAEYAVCDSAYDHAEPELPHSFVRDVPGGEDLIVYGCRRVRLLPWEGSPHALTVNAPRPAVET